MIKPTRRLIVIAALGAVVALLLSDYGVAAPLAVPAVTGGCQKPGNAGLMTLSTLDGNAQSRTFLVQVPAGYAPARAYPVAFVFHGGGGDAKQAFSWGLQRAAGAAEAAIFVFPNGLPLKDGVGWDDRPDGADLPFFDNMLKKLAAAYCIDAEKIFVAGFSWGGDFVVALACGRGDVIRAVEANSTDDEFKDAKNYLTYQGLPCASHKHPSIRFEHAENGDSSYAPPNFATTSQLFRYLNSCSTATENTPSSTAGTKCVTYSACSGGYAECIFDKRMGHSLPPNWAEDTWKFFASFK
jgi:poly(3-hydroxybutyrate) depolymerase